MEDRPERPEVEMLIEDPLGSVQTRGRPPSVGFHLEYQRDLSEADIAALALARDKAPLRPLARIHASHHSVARCLATGMKPSQVALITGYTQVRINQLQRDQAFSALVADYQSEAKSVFADLAERMNDLSLDAIEILQERLHDSPEGFTIPVLLDLVKTFADRTGHGPNQEVHLKMSTDLIDRPPRETYEDWQSRRTKELTAPTGDVGDEPKKLN
jgi:hypothetical protein